MPDLSRLRALGDRIRSYAGPTTLDARGGYNLYPNKVEIIVSVYAGHIGEGLPTARTGYPLELLPRPMVEEVSSRDILASGGRYVAQDLKVGPITPAYTDPVAGGYTAAQLQPAVTDGASTGHATSTDVFYRLTGTLGGDYEIIDVRTEDPLEYHVTIRRLLRTP